MTDAPRLTVAEWADTHRQMRRDASAFPGRWLTSLIEPQRGIMNAVSDPTVEEVVVMAAPQTGKGQIALNAIGYHLSVDAASMLYVKPTVQEAQRWADRPLSSLLIDNLPGRCRLPGFPSDLLRFETGCGSVRAAGADEPCSLGAEPARIVFLDDLDRFPAPDAEGDAAELAIARSRCFADRKVVMLSAPEEPAGHSRITTAYEATDRRVYMVPCPACGTRQQLRFGQVSWPAAADRIGPGTASYLCEHCGSLWSDEARSYAIRQGWWLATAPFTGKAGFKFPALCNPLMPLSSVVNRWLQAKGSHEAMLRALVLG